MDTCKVIVADVLGSGREMIQGCGVQVEASSCLKAFLEEVECATVVGGGLRHVGWGGGAPGIRGSWRYLSASAEMEKSVRIKTCRNGKQEDDREPGDSKVYVSKGDKVAGS